MVPETPVYAVSMLSVGSPFTGYGLYGSGDIPPGNSYLHGETIFIL